MWSKLAPPTQESEIIERGFVGIYTVGEKVLLYVGRVTKRFLLNSDSKPTYIKLNCLKLHQPGCSGYTEHIDHLHHDILVLLIHDNIAMISDVSYENSAKWFFINYHHIESFFN